MKILVLSSHTPSLFWFRLDMMKAFQSKGYDVVAAGNENEAKWKDKFLEFNIEYRSIVVQRTGTNPLKDIATFKSIRALLKEVMPNKIFTYQAKTVIYGCFAAKSCGISEVYPMIAGLGSIFIGTGIKNSFLRRLLTLEYRFACKKCKRIFFQNNDDKQAFLKAHIVDENKIIITNGSGVNTKKFSPAPLPEKLAFLFIGRLIRDKGICEYLEACKKIKELNKQVRCLLVGPFDCNPSALRPGELQPYIDDGIIEYFGEQTDVRPYLAQCSAYVLPSYHEGTPKSVLEAMSFGRAVITTNAPGCKETVINGKNGFLVPVHDSDSVVKKMLFYIEHPDILEIHGNAGRELALKKYDVNSINRVICEAMSL